MRILDGLSAFVRVRGVAAFLFAAVFLAPAAFSQTSLSPEEEEVDLLGVADLVNLLRTVVDPSPSPVLSSPVERAVSGKAVPSAANSSGPRVVMVRPTVTLPDIVVPDADTDAPEAAVAENVQKEAEPAVAAAVPATIAEDDDSHPPFYYAFFFGDYVPYYKGWFYYSDAWFWGRRGPRPPEPPGWIPPPPPPDGPFRPGPGPRPGGGIVVDGGGERGGSRTQKTVRPKSSDNTIPVVPDQHRIPGAAARQIEFPGSNAQIPVSASQHRIPGAAARQITSPSKNDSIPVAPGAHRIPRGNGR